MFAWHAVRGHRAKFQCTEEDSTMLKHAETIEENIRKDDSTQRLVSRCSIAHV